MRISQINRPIILAALLAASPAFAQTTQTTPPQTPSAQQEEGPTTPVAPPPVVAPDALSLARDAAAHGDQPEALSRYLRILAAKPDNVEALVGAGKAALAVGDMNAAAGFLARADALNPKNGQVKAGLASTMLEKGDARSALRLFGEAVDLGVPPASIAAERGLAYDLRGSPKRAQADYQLALRNAPNDEVTRNLALSQAISGDRAAAMATLDPLLRKQDVPAWRVRAFIFALTGDPAEAQAGAALVMPADQVAALAPYLPRLAALKSADKAAAIHLGRFPGEGDAVPPPKQTASAPRIPIDRGMLGPDKATALTPPPPPVAVAQAAPPPELAPPPPPRMDARSRRAAAAAAAKEKKARQQEAFAKRNPARHWVQVAGGANKHDLGKEWAKLKGKWGSQLSGHSPWTMHYRHTNRLLIGPFSSSDAAQDWVTERKREGFATFRVETNAGDAVERVN